MFPVLLLFFVLMLAFVVVGLLSKAAQASRQPTMGPGSMGRLHEPMNPKFAASTIYSNLKSRGGLQPGRAYSTSYFNSFMPYQMVGFAQDWLWWQLVFSELNGLMMADGMAFPAYPYDYGGQSSIFFGNPNAGYAPVFYNDPTIDMGMPMDFDPGGFVSPDTYPVPDLQVNDTADWSGANLADTGIDLGSSTSVDAIGGDSFGGGDTSDFGGGDFGGGDFSDSGS